jgi:hypothetical protein
MQRRSCRTVKIRGEPANNSSKLMPLRARLNGAADCVRMKTLPAMLAAALNADEADKPPPDLQSERPTPRLFAAAGWRMANRPRREHSGSARAAERLTPRCTGRRGGHDFSRAAGDGARPVAPEIFR